MKILFVYGNMHSVGGIQTLLLRYARRLSDRGHEVSLLTAPPTGSAGETSVIVDAIEPYATVHLAAMHWLKAPGSLTRADIGDPDVIVACNLESLMLSCVLQEHRANAARLVIAVFAPREYCWHAPFMHRRWIQQRAERLLRRLPLENFWFSTDAMARQTGECLGRDLADAPVLPVAIDFQRFAEPADRAVNRRKIASVQRLTPYYKHHAQVIGVIRRLRDLGHAFEYHAYGDGETLEEIRAHAEELGVGDAVFLHGAVPYERFTEAVSDAFVYIGNGTGMIEAAACGVPTLVSIDSHPGPFTHGFFQDTHGNDLGGYVPDHPEVPILDRILWLDQLSGDEYREVGLGSRARAHDFSLDAVVPQLERVLAHASRFSVRTSRLSRTLARLDGLRATTMRRFGIGDAMANRHVRPPSETELERQRDSV